MNVLIIQLYIVINLICNVGLLTSKFIGTTDLIAVSSSIYAKKLYQDIRNEDVPSTQDPATLDARIRGSICKNIFNSRYFVWLSLVSNETIILNRHRQGYAEIFNEIYSLTNSIYEYRNPYRLRDFFFLDFGHFKEYVFICAIKNQLNKHIITYYVSKEYNVDPVDVSYKPGRFVFGTYVKGYPYSHILLAEETVEPYIELGFNVELYYLQMRRYVQPAESNEIDPLCKLISADRFDPNNQHRRLCVAVTESPSIRTKVRYPLDEPYPCFKNQVSFRTAAAVEYAAGKLYYERMTVCYSTYEYYISPLEGEILFISRAYKTNEVFVYRLDPLVKKIYLENLSGNISIVDELNSFDFIEN